MIDERREEQAGLYALGALPPEERAEFEAAVRLDPALQLLVQELQSAAQALARAVPPVEPPARLRQAILERVQPAENIVPIPATNWHVWLPWAMAACLAIACVAMWVQGQRFEHRSAALQTELEDVKRRATALAGQTGVFQKQLAVLDQELTTLRNKDALSEMKIAFLGSLLENTPKAVAVSLWDKDRQGGVLIVRDLAPLPADKDYQLWVIEEKNPSPVSAGVFTVDSQGAVRLTFKPVREIRAADKFAISVERKGGSPNAPQGQVVMAGN